jgi:hypothetical protein
MHPDAKTHVQHNLSWHTSCEISTEPIRTLEIMRQCFVPRMYHNALLDLQIVLDAKTQIHYNVSRHAFCGTYTGPTQA